MALNLSGRVGRAATVQPTTYRNGLGRAFLASRENLQPTAAQLFPGNPASDVERRREAGVTPTGHKAT